MVTMDTVTEASQFERVVDVEGIAARLREARVQHMLYLLNNRWTYERIGKLYGMSKQQVFAIIKRANVDGE